MFSFCVPYRFYSSKEDVYRPYERNRILELQLLSFSTGQPHPLAEQPVIFIDERNLSAPLNTQSTKIEIVGDFLVLLISFPEWSMNQDMFLLVRWKTGVTHCVRVPGSLEIRAPSLILLCSARVSRKGNLQPFHSPLARHPCDP
jgi:hypothetical protein